MKTLPKTPPEQKLSKLHFFSYYDACITTIIISYHYYYPILHISITYDCICMTILNLKLEVLIHLYDRDALVLMLYYY